MSRQSFSISRNFVPNSIFKKDIQSSGSGSSSSFSSSDITVTAGSECTVFENYSKIIGSNMVSLVYRITVPASPPPSRNVASISASYAPSFPIYSVFTTQVDSALVLRNFMIGTDGVIVLILPEELPGQATYDVNVFYTIP